MDNDNQKSMGFCCSYTPLPLIHAAGFTPYRLFPMGHLPDRAGSILHDNLCPHVKRILDRVLSKDLPELAGMIFMDSCESMRRLADAWQSVHPSDHHILITLPSHADEAGIQYFSGQLRSLSKTLSGWAGSSTTTEALAKSIEQYSALAQRLSGLEQRAAAGELSRSVLQELLNRSVTQPIAGTLAELDELQSRPASFDAKGRAPVFLFGNVLPDPKALALFEDSGCWIVGADFCTGSRQHAPYDHDDTRDPYLSLARSLLARPPCARSVSPQEPGALARRILEAARRTKARGVAAHIAKFCDPYLARVPSVLKTLKAEGLPSLILDSDCTMQSFGQHKTRIEAFAEMLAPQTKE